jgi:hypothetical protein
MIKSICCNAPVTVAGNVTKYYVCGKCGTPTIDSEPTLEEMQDYLRDADDYPMPLRIVDAIRATLTEHAALVKENAELKTRLGDINTTSFYALKDAYAALRAKVAEWQTKANEILETPSAIIDLDSAYDLLSKIRDLASSGETP